MHLNARSAKSKSIFIRQIKPRTVESMSATAKNVDVRNSLNNTLVIVIFAYKVYISLPLARWRRSTSKMNNSDSDSDDGIRPYLERFAQEVYFSIKSECLPGYTHLLFENTLYTFSPETSYYVGSVKQQCFHCEKFVDITRDKRLALYGNYKAENAGLDGIATANKNFHDHLEEMHRAFKKRSMHDDMIFVCLLAACILIAIGSLLWGISK